MKVTLGKLAIKGIETYAGGASTACVQAALLHYAGRLRSSRPPVEVPDFLRELRSCGAVEVVEPPIDRATEAALEREARRQRTSLEEISVHAVLVYLAELDAAHQGTPEGLR